MESNNQKFKRLYEKYQLLNTKLDKTRNPLGPSILGGTLATVGIYIGGKVININISPYLFVGSFLVGETIVWLPLYIKLYKINKTEKKLIVISNNDVKTNEDGSKTYNEVTYSPCDRSYLSDYYDQLTNENNNHVKKLGK